MSRTFRKKYVPIASHYESEEIREGIRDSEYYAQHGETIDGLTYYTPHYEHKSLLRTKKFIQSVGRDGNKAHADLYVMMQKAIKRTGYRVRPVMKQELRNMRAGNLGWDENIANPQKLKMLYRGFRWYEI